MQFSETKVIRELHPKLTVKIFEQDVHDILCSALNGGIGYWSVLDNSSDAFENAPSNETVEETAARLLLSGTSLVFNDFESECCYKMSLEDFVNGINEYLEAGHSEIVNNECLDCCSIDSVAADSIIQYAIFGEVTYA